VAWILASNGRRVLAIDWDLEAPGLHRYYTPFLLDKDLTSSEGLIDFVTDFAVEMVTPDQPLAKNAGNRGHQSGEIAEASGDNFAGESNKPDENQSDGETEWYSPFTNILRFAVSLDYPFPVPGTLDFVPAGRQGPSYATRVNLFNWQRFYDRLGGGTFLEAAKQRMRAEYDYILIDSRTGVSDTSGICTVQMPDVLVVCFTPNNQSIEGAAAAATSVRKQWKETRGDTYLKIFPVLTRVDTSEKEKLDLRREYARQEFDTFLQHLSPSKREEYWGSTEIPYVPFYAYEEILAVFGDKPSEKASQLAAMERLTSYITDGAVQGLAEPPTDDKRRAILVEYTGLRPQPEVSRSTLTRPSTTSSVQMQNQVFLSYRAESSEHVAAVRRLGELLRQAKIPVALDQFYLDDNPGGPDEGWPKWCEDCASQAACVLIIASEGWFASYDKSAEPGGGLGAATDADLYRQAFWNETGHNERFRLAFLHEVAANKVPVRLRTWHSFRPFESDAAFDELLRWLAARLGLQGTEQPTVRWPDPLPDFQPDLADRVSQWSAILDMLVGRSRERILLLEGASGFGKSALVRYAAQYANQLGILVMGVNFKAGELDVAALLGQFDLDLGDRLPNFSRQGGDKTHLLRKDLRTLRQPVLIIFDSYEHVAENKIVADWLSQQLLNEVVTAQGLAVIVAGQRVPDLTNASWREMARHLQLGPITEPADWERWITRRYPSFRDKGAHLPTVLVIAHGSPAVVATACEAIAKS
jgi:hypothetical protein